MHDLAIHQVYNRYDLQGVLVQIFVFEYVTGGGMLDEDVPPSLAYEGDMMLRALISDLSEIPDLHLTTLRDARLDEPDWAADVHYVYNDDDFRRGWRELLADADAVWPVAPETGERLERSSRSVVSAGKLLLNSRPDAVRLAASKLRTAVRLRQQGLPVVPTYRLPDCPRDIASCWVVKPDDGVGCLGTRICRSEDELAGMAQDPALREACVVQPFVEGVPGSLCLLCRNGEARLLSCNRQRVVVSNDEFHLLGCIVNGMADGHARYARLARAVAAAMPGLWGLVGVDFIESRQGPLLLEINPRLTSSYLGLKPSLGENPAALVLDLIDGGEFGPAKRRAPEAIDVSLEAGHAT
jgi:predicted ATP-grasp superfamily ATP-dependent carboligase